MSNEIEPADSDLVPAGTKAVVETPEGPIGKWYVNDDDTWTPAGTDLRLGPVEVYNQMRELLGMPRLKEALEAEEDRRIPLLRALADDERAPEPEREAARAAIKRLGGEA
jgi:hypothetical protein